MGEDGHSIWRRRAAKHGCWVPSAPAPRFWPLQATHVKPESLPSCSWQVPPFSQGPLEQLSRGTSQSRPWGERQGWGPQGPVGANRQPPLSSHLFIRSFKRSSGQELLSGTGGRWGTQQATLPSGSSPPPPRPSLHPSLHSPYSRWSRHTCTLEGGHCGSCPGSGTGWTSRDHTWPGQPEWGDLEQGEGVPMRRRREAPLPAQYSQTFRDG